jgi:hypothetical protein
MRFTPAGSVLGIFSLRTFSIASSPTAILQLQSRIVPTGGLWISQADQ